MLNNQRFNLSQRPNINFFDELWWTEESRISVGSNQISPIPDSKVDQNGSTIRVDQNIAWFEISMRPVAFFGL